MPTKKEWQDAINWAKEQSYADEENEISVVDDEGNINSHFLVHFVREYFNNNNIDYSNFNFDDCEPYI